MVRQKRPESTKLFGKTPLASYPCEQMLHFLLCELVHASSHHSQGLSATVKHQGSLARLKGHKRTKTGKLNGILLNSSPELFISL